MHTLRAHILSDCSTGPTYIHKGTRRVKKGNTKPRPFWLNVYFIVIKMPALLLCVYIHNTHNIGICKNEKRKQKLLFLLLLVLLPCVLDPLPSVGGA